MELVKIGRTYYNPKHIVYLRQNDDDKTLITVGVVETYGFSEKENLEETVKIITEQAHG